MPSRALTIIGLLSFLTPTIPKGYTTLPCHVIKILKANYYIKGFVMLFTFPFNYTSFIYIISYILSNIWLAHICKYIGAFVSKKVFLHLDIHVGFYAGESMKKTIPGWSHAKAMTNHCQEPMSYLQLGLQLLWLGRWWVKKRVGAEWQGIFSKVRLLDCGYGSKCREILFFESVMLASDHGNIILHNYLSCKSNLHIISRLNIM